MRGQRILQSIIPVMLVASFLVACGGASVTTPVSEPPTATSAPPSAIPTSTVAPTHAPPATTANTESATATVQSGQESYEIVRDIPYQKDGSDYAQARGKLDLYLPRGRENFPVLVWFHGGALMYEDKSESYATKVARRLASEGVGVVVPNYRLNPLVKYPTYIEDAASATAWVYHNIATYQGNPKQLFVGGHSSGAYLAAMIAMDERYLKQHQLLLQQIAGAILMSGEMYGDTTVWGERGIDKSTIDETKIDETTPMFYVRRDVPALLNMCAEYDEANVCEENQRFIEALRATGHKNVTFEKIPGRSHFSIADLESPPDNPVVKLMLTFIQKATSGK